MTRETCTAGLKAGRLPALRRGGRCPPYPNRIMRKGPSREHTRANEIAHATHASTIIHLPSTDSSTVNGLLSRQRTPRMGPPVAVCVKATNEGIALWRFLE